MTINQVIPRETALKLCGEIRTENRRKWLSMGRLQCWGCYKFTRGDPEKMCLSNERGCNLVNNRYKLREGHQ